MIKKCPYATNFRLDKCIKLLDWLEKKRDKLDSPVKKRGVESIIKNLDLKQKPFYVLLATILSLRTRDQTTYQSAKKLFEKIKKPEDILKLPEKELEKLIYPA
jgi:endonuclease III